MENKPENFVMTVRNGTAHIERNLEFGQDKISLQIAVRPKDDIEMTLTQYHRASLQIAIHHLQELLKKSDAPK